MWLISLFHVCLLVYKVCLLKACIYTALANLQLALVEVNDVRVAVGQQTLGAPFTTDTTFLVAGEDAVNTVSILLETWLEGSLTLEGWASRMS